MGTLNGLFQVLNQLAKDGKALYARSDKARRDDYTLSKVLKRVRREMSGTDKEAPPVK
ncbi:hypothetical protein [Hymenobacter algoricola]|uniref:Uncharacterized protein n=1 Tax=Hymenobacter algoricola TaxID=486267 RepID=A0ABP7N7Y5_9BACT